MSKLTGCYPILKVDCLDTAESFYCDLLGFDLVSEYQLGESRDPGYMSLRRDDVWLHLSSFPSDGTSGTAVYLDTEDIDGLRDEFVSAGFEADKLELLDQSWGRRELYLHDPDGNVLRFAAVMKA